MGLLSKEKSLIENDYFRVWDIVELISKDGFYSWEEVGQFLGHHDFDTKFILCEQDSYCRIHEILNNYSIIRKLINGLQVVWLEGEESIQKIKREIGRYYWHKHEILNFKPLMDLGILEKPSPQKINIPPVSKAPKPIKPVQGSSYISNTKKITANLELDVAIEKQEVEKLNKEVEHLKAKNLELENERLQFIKPENAMVLSEINLPNSDLLLISALLRMLQNEIQVKGNKSQAKVLQRIEDEHRSIKGLSKSRTEKILASANSLYKSLINN